MKRLCLAVASCAFSFLLLASARADTTLVFNEIMYHPPNTDATNEAMHEWVEFYNQMSVDVDVSGWTISGDIGYTFPANSRLAGRGFIVIAASPATILASSGQTNITGPFTNRLSNSGGTLRLRNNAGRLMDEINYGTEGEWPGAPDRSGVSLAKRNRDTGSAAAANWAASAQVGGTPGTDNFPGASSSSIGLISIGTMWKYEASGTDLGTGWSAANFDDTAWPSRFNLTNRAVPGLFNTGLDAAGAPVADGGNDAHYLLSYGAQGTPGMAAIVTLNHPAWLANDSASKWISVVNPGTTSINGGGYGYKTTFSLAGFVPSTAQLNFSVAIDNALTNVFLNGVAAGSAFAGFASFSSPFTLSSGFVSGTNTLEFGTENQGAGPGAFRATVSATAYTANTNSPLPAGPSTYYFRKGFTFAGNPQYTTLSINPIVADGAVFYLNGVEVHRQNLPAGAISYATPALSDVSAVNYSGPITIPAGSLVVGTNVLAVEVHQAAGSPDGPLVDVDLSYVPVPVPSVALAFNELSASTNGAFWLELMNYGTNALALDGLVIHHEAATNHEYVIPSGVTLNGGAFLALTNGTLGFLPSSGERLFLYSSNRVAVHDAVVVKKGARARYPDGTGTWLIPGAPTPGAANSFAFDNRIVINEIMYSHKSFPAVTTNIPPKDNPEAWIELYNRRSNTVDLSGWKLSGGVSYKFAAGRTLAAGAYLVIADDLTTFHATYPAVDAVGNLGGKLSGNDDRIVLEDPVGNPANEVHYYSSGRWPGYAGGGGSSLELRDPLADNSKAEAWAASDESGKSGWQTYTYRFVAIASSPTPTPDNQWRDFIMGLLADGECYVDDISVLQSPGSGQIQLISNGNFESGITGWRVIGNHRLSRVDIDPENPANHALHLIANGPQEHMHNHIEATWAGGNTIVNGNTYQVSFRAKWIAGNNLLNTRGYFNRIARTTPISYPQLNGTPGARNSRYATNVGPTYASFAHTPVAPAAGQSVTVTVQAQDPQGVASCSVFWSVNGGAWSNAAMSLQNGIYSGTIPGQVASALVQFYVRGTDGLGAVSTFPANGTNSAAFYRVFDGAANLAALHNIRILLSPANVALLHATTNVMSNEVLPCTVIYDERKAYYDMGVRLKSSERGRAVSGRVGFHLEFQPDDLFRGVHPVMLVDRSNGGSRPANEEIILRHIMLHAGVPAVNPDLIRVLSPQVAEYGTAIFAPRFEDEFAGAQFANGGKGSFYELELIYYPTTVDAGGYKIPNPDGIATLDYQNLGGDKELYRYNFIKKNHRDTDDYSPFITFAKMFSLTGAQLQLETAQTMDINEWMSAYGAITLCGVGDMYTFGNNHNFMTHIRASDQKSVYLPWDMDFSFNNGTSSALVGNQNLANIVNLTPNLRCFYAHVLDHVSTTFNTTYLTYWISHYGALAGQNYSADVAYVQARGDFAKTTIGNAGGTNAFNVATASVITNGSGLITLTGTAPVWVKTITINGATYPITWTSLSGWSITLPVSAASNNLEVVALDLNDTVTNSATRTVFYTNAAPNPVGTVVFNEIMYNPYLPDSAYVELFNTSLNASFDLSGWKINGIDFTFPAGSFITNRQFVVVAANAASYAGAYGFAAGAPLGEFSGVLQNGGETLTLLKPGSMTNDPMIVVDKVRYDSVAPWSTNANGTGSSLQVIDPNQDNSRVGDWFSGYVPAVTVPAVSTPAVLRDGWRFFSASGSSGTGENGSGPMRFLLYLGEAGTAWIDDLFIVPGTNAGVGPNYVSNGDFESALVFGLTNSWVFGTNYTNTTIVGDLVHAGAGAFKIVGASPGAANNPTYSRSMYQFLSPAPPINTTNTLSFWYWATNSATNLYARVRNSAFLQTSTNSGFTNINIFITPSNYVPAQILTAATNSLTPGRTNEGLATLPAFPSLWLNEVQPENTVGILDSRGEREAWVEIYNRSTNTLSLDGLFLTSTYTNLTNWAFPPGSSLGPTQFLIVFCDGEPGETTNSEYHTSFTLPPASGGLALSRLYGGVPQVIDYLNYAGVHAGRSFGSFPDGQSFERQEFFYVTPGGTNDGRFPPITVFINELMAQNSSIVADPADGHFEDWFELYNPGTNAVDLAGYFLTDALTNKFKFEITTNMAHVIPPRGYLLVWADNETGQNTSLGVPRADLHVNFSLAAGGEQIGLFARDGTAIDQVTFFGQMNDVTLGRYPDGAAQFYFMPGTATPRAANQLAAPPNAAPVLDFIGSKILFLGQTLAFTATATDSDTPAQTLTFSLDPGVPAGASITGAGAFTWMPAAVGTNSITVRVTDDGSPALDASETITVEVLAAPGFTRSLRNGDNVELTWRTRAGKKYAVDYKNDLNTVPWTPLWTNTALGDSLSFTNVATNLPQRFFRIRTVD